MIKAYQLFFLFAILLSCTSLYAQNDSIADTDYYFDDNRISDGKNIVKINFLSLGVGDLPVNYERTFGNSLALEVGIGVLLPYYGRELLWDDTIISKPDLGYSLSIHPKFYFFRFAPEFSYLGFQYRQRNYHQNNQTVVFSDYIIDFGYQFILGKRTVLDIYYGIGFRIKNEKTLQINSGISGIVMPGGIKFGLIF